MAELSAEAVERSAHSELPTELGKVFTELGKVLSSPVGSYICGCGVHKRQSSFFNVHIGYVAPYIANFSYTSRSGDLQLSLFFSGLNLRF